ncbi:LacI family DNA-binding transcriptional regulator [Paenibacillus tarimensis]
MTVTIKDVARLAGVSPSTVSRVISNHPRISKATAVKVREIMEQIGYHPNVMAKSLVSKTTSTLAIFLPRPAEELFLNLFFSEFIRGMVARASKSGYDMMITSSTSEHDEVAAITRLVRSKRVDGVILMSSRRNDPVVHYLEEQQFPFILIGRNEEYPDIMSVDNDNVQASYDATKHLIDRGHTRIGFVSGPPHLIMSKDRMKGYEKALREANLPLNPQWIVEGEFLQESGYRAMSLIMSLLDRPTALVVIDDVVAFGIVRGLNEIGYSVPQNMSLISFNNTALTELSSPPISSVDISIYQLGYLASQNLIQAVKGESKERYRMIVPHRLVVRDSSSNTIPTGS